MFVLLLPRPPISTLFPYTTLFRSRREANPDRIHVLALAAEAVEQHHCRPTRGGRRAGRRGLAGSDAVDRKSTRLNSSHRCISYAVFCLKKKKKKAMKTAGRMKTIR